jgi:hypothetical protein
MRHALPLALLALLLTACPEPLPEAPTEYDLRLHRESAQLTQLGLEAVGLAPAWLRHDVGIALRLQADERADELAALLVEAEDPRYLDEIAFVIAHLSPEVMASEDFYPELIALNATLIYARDADLDYVELTETGQAGVDDDFHTTTTYTWERAGELVTESIDRDTYYWYVVHPRLEDEHPWYIDGWDPCPAATLQCPSTPEFGWFWRDFLWSAAQDECPEGAHCPVLRDFVGNARVTDDESVRTDIAWNGEGGGGARGAVREMVEFMFSADDEGQRWLVFGAFGERSVQPNRIYGLGRGNCGEWADMTTAALRTILLPAMNVKPTSWDHTWNSFWTGDRWAETEPVNYCIDCTYHGSPATVGARGDTSVQMQTADYSSETFTMEVEVVDDEGEPVVGASVRAFAPWVIDDTTYWDSAGELPTDASGVASFELEVGHEFGVRVETLQGSWPEADNTLSPELQPTVPAGAVEVVEVEMGWELPVTDFDLDALSGEELLTVTFGPLEGRALTLGQRFGHTFSSVVPAPALDLVLVDQAGYDALRDGEPFDACWAGNAGDAQIELPEGDWHYLVLLNPTLATAAGGELSLAVGEASLQTPFELLPGGYLSILIDPA